MAAVSEFKQYANECLRWAAEAETEEERKALLDLARYWTLAVLRLEGVMQPAETDAPLRRTGQVRIKDGPFLAEQSWVRSD